MKTHAIRESRVVKPAELFIFMAVLSLMVFNMPAPLQHFFRSEIKNTDHGTALTEVPHQLVNSMASEITPSVEIPVISQMDACASVKVAVTAFMNASEILQLATDIQSEPVLALESWMVADEFWEIQAPAAAHIPVKGQTAGDSPALMTGLSEMQACLIPAADPELALEEWMSDENAWMPSAFGGATESPARQSEQKIFDFHAFSVRIRINELLKVEEESPLKLSAWMLSPDNFRTSVSSGTKLPSEKP